jgi:hypothetical protein
MKKQCYLLLLMAMPFFAQSQVRIGVQGGFTFARTEMAGYAFQDLQASYKLGPMAGVMVGLNLGESNFSLMQEFNFVIKGANIHATDLSANSPVTVTGKHTTQYLEMPLNLLYYLNAGNGHFFFGAGPYTAMGIGGSNKYRYDLEGAAEAEDSDVNFGKDMDELRKWDFGLQGLIGYKLGYGSYVKAFYTHGLTDISNSGAFTYHNRYFGLSFGYFFGSGK